jgi:hypothetical protein
MMTRRILPSGRVRLFFKRQPTTPQEATMAYYPNENDWSENFWKNNYRILVSAQGIEFFVNADNEQEALDYIIDYCEDNLPGLLWDDEDLDEMNEEEKDKYICGGNHGRYLSTHNIHIETVKR